MFVHQFDELEHNPLIIIHIDPVKARRGAPFVLIRFIILTGIERRFDHFRILYDPHIARFLVVQAFYADPVPDIADDAW